MLQYLKRCSALCLFTAVGMCHAQGMQPPNAGPAAVKTAIGTSASTRLEELFIADTIPKVLGKFTPPVNEAQVTPSDYLLLDAPQVALPGKATVRLKSELPGTDLFLLFNAKPREKEPSLLSANIIAPLTSPEASVEVTLTATTDLLLIARANGRWYKVTSEVKIAEADGKPKSVQKNTAAHAAKAR